MAVLQAAGFREVILPRDCLQVFEMHMYPKNGLGTVSGTDLKPVLPSLQPSSDSKLCFPIC